MKLYTEEQLSIAINVAKANPEQSYLILCMLKPIEIPSDNEIVDKSKQEPDNSDIQTASRIGYVAGAKWMRDKILGGNK
jgi:hypothetical protein